MKWLVASENAASWKNAEAVSSTRVVTPSRFLDKKLQIVASPELTVIASDTMAHEHSVVAVNWTAVNVRTAVRVRASQHKAASALSFRVRANTYLLRTSVECVRARIKDMSTTTYGTRG